MNRFARIALTGIGAVLACASADAQQQQGQNQQVQKAPPGKAATGGNSTYHGGYGQTPWFSNPQVRQQFKLTDQQYNQLNKSYGESYGRYQQDMDGFDKNLTNEQRAQKMGELQLRFNKDFSVSTNAVFSDPQQQQRYSQLYLQYQGYNAFSDPSVQEKLNLTLEQRQKMGQFGQEWQNQMNGIGNTYQTDPDGTTRQFNEMRKQSGERINTVLTPEQQSSWQQMTGESYQFQPNMYFQMGPGLGNAGTGKLESPLKK
jgi:opacity protein-like surface antigen